MIHSGRIGATFPPHRAHRPKSKCPCGRSNRQSQSSPPRSQPSHRNPFLAIRSPLTGAVVITPTTRSVPVCQTTINFIISHIARHRHRPERRHHHQKTIDYFCLCQYFHTSSSLLFSHRDNLALSRTHASTTTRRQTVFTFLHVNY